MNRHFSRANGSLQPFHRQPIVLWSEHRGRGVWCNPERALDQSVWISHWHWCACPSSLKVLYVRRSQEDTAQDHITSTAPTSLCLVTPVRRWGPATKCGTWITRMQTSAYAVYLQGLWTKEYRVLIRIHPRWIELHKWLIRYALCRQKTQVSIDSNRAGVECCLCCMVLNLMVCYANKKKIIYMAHTYFLWFRFIHSFKPHEFSDHTGFCYS